MTDAVVGFRRGTAQFLVFCAVAFALPVVAATPAVAGTMTLTPHTWNRDPLSGKVSYDLQLSATGTNDPDGPCVGSCTWRIDTYYLNGSTTELVREGLRSGSGNRPSFTVRPTASGVAMPEVTHVRAWLYSTYNYSPLTTWDSGLVTVAAPATGGLSLTSNTWDRDPVSGFRLLDSPNPGEPTRWYTVVTRPDGTLVSAYPGTVGD